jgi:hypothetical protein
MIFQFPDSPVLEYRIGLGDVLYRHNGPRRRARSRRSYRLRPSNDSTVHNDNVYKTGVLGRSITVLGRVRV